MKIVTEDKEDLKIHFDSDQITVKTSTIVRLHEYISVIAEDGIHDLKIDITADLGTVSEKYREVFFNIITSKYMGKVSFGDNPFSVCRPPEKIRWYQFWKWKIFHK